MSSVAKSIIVAAVAIFLLVMFVFSGGFSIIYYLSYATGLQNLIAIIIFSIAIVAVTIYFRFSKKETDIAQGGMADADSCMPADENSLRCIFKKNLDVYLVLFIFLFQSIFLAGIDHFYGVMGHNRYSIVSYLVVFLVPFFAAMASEKYTRSLVFSGIFSAIFLVATFGPFLIFAALVMVVPIFAFVGVVLGGFFIGRVIRSRFASNIYAIIKYGLVLMFFLNMILIFMIARNLDDCESFTGEGKVSCYENKALRKNDENVCGNIDEQYDRDACYRSAIFSSGEDDNYESASQCDVITNATDREHCYISFAEEKLDQGVCGEYISNEKARSECLDKVDESFCAKMSFGEIKDYCDTKIRLREFGDVYVSEADRMKFENSKEVLGGLYEEYKKALQEENRTGDSLHAKSKRITDIDQIRYISKSTIELMKRCQQKNLTVKSNLSLQYMCGSPAESWSVVSACGEEYNTKWDVFYNNGEWEFTLRCKDYPECSGIENTRCNKDGCVFSEKCRP